MAEGLAIEGVLRALLTQAGEKRRERTKEPSQDKDDDLSFSKMRVILVDLQASVQRLTERVATLESASTAPPGSAQAVAAVNAVRACYGLTNSAGLQHLLGFQDNIDITRIYLLAAVCGAGPSSLQDGYALKPAVLQADLDLNTPTLRALLELCGVTEVRWAAIKADKKAVTCAVYVPPLRTCEMRSVGMDGVSVRSWQHNVCVFQKCGEEL